MNLEQVLDDEPDDPLGLGDAWSPDHDHVPIVAGWVPAAVATIGLAELQHRRGQEAVYRRPPGVPASAELLGPEQLDQIGLALHRLARRGVTVRRLVADDVMIDGATACLRGTCRPEVAAGRSSVVRRVHATRRARRLLAGLAVQTALHDGEQVQESPSAPPVAPDAGLPGGARPVVVRARPRRSGRARTRPAAPIALGTGLGLLAVVAIGWLLRDRPPSARDAVVAPVAAPAELRHGGGEYRVGRVGDLVVIGDWDGDGMATPAVVRPATGAVYRWDRWPADGSGSPGTMVATVAPASDVVVVPCAAPPPGGSIQLDLDSGSGRRACLRATEGGSR